ncbi:hypothetical protein WKR98_13495 [Pigmentiphaga sp. YJ18]|uniref:hypothetical protein n=1 Tax=Pigmentiphaga sp. YJ18 TaxID=3134907 RepID=UPI0031174DB2
MTTAAIVVAIMALVVIPLCAADIIRRGLKPPFLADGADEAARQRDAAAEYLAAPLREGGE